MMRADANLDIVDNDDWHPLWALRKGDVLLVQDLIKQGAALDIVEPNGRTALHNAASGGDVKLVETLT